MWHIRVWYYPLKAYYEVFTKGRKKYLLDWKKKMDQAGGIKNLRTKTKRIASFDDCDYNMHLSNSYVPLLLFLTKKRSKRGSTDLVDVMPRTEMLLEWI
jgi:hypothetical protein